MVEFSYRLQVLYGFYRGKGRSGGTLIEWGRDVHVLVAVFPPPSLLQRRVLLNSGPRRQAIKG